MMKPSMIKRCLRINLVVILVALFAPGQTQAAIECDANNIDTLCHVYLAAILTGD